MTPRSIGFTAQLAADVAQALAALHDRRIVVRTLSAATVRLTARVRPASLQDRSHARRTAPKCRMRRCSTPLSTAARWPSRSAAPAIWRQKLPLPSPPAPPIPRPAHMHARVTHAAQADVWALGVLLLELMLVRLRLPLRC